MFDLFHLVTWDDLDLYYGHKAQEMILTDVSDTIHADSLTLFALNIEILLADVAKPEKSKILTLTWPVTSSVTSGSNIWPCTDSSRTGLSNGVWNLEIGPVVWEISGGALWAPPPAGRVTNQTPAGRGLTENVFGDDGAVQSVRCQSVRRAPFGPKSASLCRGRWSVRRVPVCQEGAVWSKEHQFVQRTLIGPQGASLSGGAAQPIEQSPRWRSGLGVPVFCVGIFNCQAGEYFEDNK